MLMFSTRFTLVLLAGLLSAGYAAANVAPSVADITEDGFTYQELTFLGEKIKVTLALPPAWSFRGNKSRLQLTPPGKPFVEGSIEAVPLPEPKPLDPETLEAFKQQATASVPAGSQAIVVESEGENTIMPEGSPSYEVVLGYQSLGKSFKRSVLLVNGPTERLIVRFSAPKEDFAALATPFRRSLMSWRTTELKPAAAGAVPPAVPPAQ
jgi:hypothetical protein